MNFLNIEMRKKNTYEWVDYLEKFCTSIMNKRDSAFLLSILHTFSAIWIALYLCFGDTQTLFYKFNVVIWLIVVGCHFYFNGCLLVRLERKLWNSKTWFGPWMIPLTFLKQCGYTIGNPNIMFYIVGSITTIVALIRLLSPH